MKLLGKLLGPPLLLLSMLACSEARLEASYILHGGDVYTVDERKPWAQAIVVHDDAIVFVGTVDGAMRYKGDDTVLIDTTDRLVLPGFIDAHVHPIKAGRAFTEVNLRSSTSKADFQAALKAYVQDNPDLPYIVGRGWVMENFSEDRPHRIWIDEVMPDVPVILYDHFLHSALVNSKALNLAEITEGTPNPTGGIIDRDAAGDMTGILREAPAFALVDQLFSDTTPEMDYRALQAAVKYLNQNGITSFVSAYMSDEPMGQTYVDALLNDELTARTTLLFPITADMPVEETLDRIKSRRAELESYDAEFIRADMVKLFLDGVILSHTAAMLSPYEGEKSEYDFEAYLFPDEVLSEFARRLNAEDFSLYFHAVGDGAARQALNTVEDVLSGRTDMARTPSISHLAVLDPEDAARFGELGVMANSQFYWGKHQEIITLVEAYIGPARSEWIFPYGGIDKAGGTLVAGSDWPISTPNPFFAMQVSATRPYTSVKKAEDDVFGGDAAWLPEHKVDVPTMIRAFTIEGAKLQSWEDIIGSIEVGKRADLIVVDQNLLNIPVNKIHETKVLLTMVDGNIVFEK